MVYGLRCCLFGALCFDCFLLRLTERGAVVVVLVVGAGLVVSMPEVLRCICRSALGGTYVGSRS